MKGGKFFYLKKKRGFFFNPNYEDFWMLIRLDNIKIGINWINGPLVYVTYKYTFLAGADITELRILLAARGQSQQMGENFFNNAYNFEEVDRSDFPLYLHGLVSPEFERELKTLC